LTLQQIATDIALYNNILDQTKGQKRIGLFTEQIQGLGTRAERQGLNVPLIGEQQQEVGGLRKENIESFNQVLRNTTVETNRNSEALILNRQQLSIQNELLRRNNFLRETPEQQIVRNLRNNFATGGPVGTDTVNAWLTPGEFVINRAASARNFSLLTAINSGSKSVSNHYAAGGVVTTFNNTFNQTTTSNLRANTRRTASELQRQIGLGQTTLRPKAKVPF
jgi:hypothetical protein